MAELSSFAVFLAIASLGFLFLIVSLAFGEVFEHFGDHDTDSGPSFFSPRVLAVFITAFGGTGALATHYGLGTVPASGTALLGGVAFATLIYQFARFLYGQQANTQVTAQDLTGRTGRVIVAIPAHGVGQVRVQLGEELVDKVAKTRTGQAVDVNSLIVVEQTAGELVIVRPA